MTYVHLGNFQFDRLNNGSWKITWGTRSQEDGELIISNEDMTVFLECAVLGFCSMRGIPLDVSPEITDSLRDLIYQV